MTSILARGGPIPERSSHRGRQGGVSVGVGELESHLMEQGEDTTPLHLASAEWLRADDTRPDPAFWVQLLHRNVKRFRGGLVFKARRRLYHSTRGVRVIRKKKKVY